MKVLYVSSNHYNNPTLMSDHEITELQNNSTWGVGRKLDFIFLPALAIDRLEEQISLYKPDIVHISAHGETESIELVDSIGQKRDVTGSLLKALFASHTPRLVYLNACNSLKIAEELATVVSYTIGTDAPISNYAARKGAVAFYRAVSEGRYLNSAITSSQSIVSLLDNGVETRLFVNPSEQSVNPVLYRPVRIVAQLVDDEFETDDNGFAWFDVGLVGCPPCTSQVVFCTTDKSFLTNGDVNAETDLCSVVLDVQWNGEVWARDHWATWGDIRIYALAITAEGYHISASSTLIEAITAFYEVHFSGSVKNFNPKLIELLRELQANDGSRLRPLNASAPPKGRPKRKPSKKS